MINGMKTRSKQNGISQNEENGLEDSVLEESYVLLEFPEFHSTTIFQDSTFEKVSSDKDSGTLYKINNSSFDTVCIDKLDTDIPTCLLNDNLLLKGNHALNGMTYILLDRDSFKENMPELKQESASESKNESNVWYTNKCIEFSTGQ